MISTQEPIAKATSEQKKLIAINTPNKDIKEEFVQWITGDVNKRSTNDLTFEQANKLLTHLKVKPVAQDKDPFEYFDHENTQHKRILAQMYTLGWTKPGRNKNVPDMSLFAHWLKNKSPIKKPLKDMTPRQTSKVIFAFGKVVSHLFS
ncbi:MAG: regulatory protein GemA [Flavobacteriaceae bacterium]|nr:regulatory protein GemA [Flavobacteriaceae bacterium]